VNYLSAAQTYLERGVMLVPNYNGGLIPLQHWPPLYPAMIAGLSRLLGASAPEAARWLGIFLAPINVLLLGVLARRVGINAGATLFILGVFVTSLDFLYIDVSAWSEQSCLSFWLGGAILLLEYGRAGRWGWLLSAALAAGAAVMTRYSAVAQIAAGACLALWWTSGRLPRKLLAAAAYTVIAMAPLVIWQLSRGGSGMNAGRSFHAYFLKSFKIAATWEDFLLWLAPIRDYRLPIVSQWLPVLVVLGAGVVVAMAWWTNRQRNLPQDGFKNETAHRATALFLLNLLAQEGTLFLSGMFLDPFQHFSPRMQTIPHVIVLLLGGRFWTTWLRPRLTAANGLTRSLAVATLAVFLAGHLWIADLSVKHANRFMVFNAPDWRYSPAMDLIRRRYPQTPLFTNQREEVYWELGRTDIYRIFNLNQVQDTAEIGYLAPQMNEQTINKIKEKNAVIVYFTVIKQHPLLARWWQSNPELRVVDETSDAIFLRPAADTSPATAGVKPASEEP
jgi:hypothetical protein